VSETLLWDMMRGAMTAKALAWAADLNVADSLAEGPRPVAELAQATSVDPDALHRTLRALASDGVLAEDEAGVFRNTEASELLGRDGRPEFAHLFGSVFYDALAGFPGESKSDFWEWLAAHRAERLAALDWQGAETVVDVGGGNGELLKGLLAHRPELRGIVFDLPETVRDESTFGDGLEFVAGSFFEAVPAGDAYVLSGILHDWNDERAGAILETIRAAAPDGARLLAIESVIAAGNEPQGSKWLDLLMLVIGGRERTEPEWRELIGGAGFAVDSLEDGLIQARCR
jgi:DNA-binding transcriptional ArsR family regulator